MRITKLELEYFRNIEKTEMTFCPGINVIIGNNAQGKTNLLESVWLCSGNRSFRGARDAQMTQFDAPYYGIRLHFADREREQQIRLFVGDKKKPELNRVPLKSPAELIGAFRCVSFTPEDLAIVKEGPAMRRDFLDVAISQIKPIYNRYLNQYNGVLEQRNALLKEIARRGSGKELLEAWDLQLARIGTAISIFREDYVRKLGACCERIYSGFSGEKESFSLSYESSVFEKGTPLEVYSDERIGEYLGVLTANLENDLRMRYTTVGAHRDDIDIQVNQISAKLYGSQGQQRSCAISLKLGEAELLKSITGEHPVILLDDVMSELDQSRQDYILNRVKDFQVLITCCDVSQVLALNTGKRIQVENGQFREA